MQIAKASSESHQRVFKNMGGGPSLLSNYESNIVLNFQCIGSTIKNKPEYVRLRQPFDRVSAAKLRKWLALM